MIRKAIAINGSLRPEGNTDRLLASFVEGAESVGARVIQSVLRDLRIQDCTGCYHCYRNSECALDDDMQIIHREVQSSDVLILAAPLYWRSLPGLMKTFVDRLYLYYPRRNGKLIAGKKVIILTPMFMNKKEHGKANYDSEIKPLSLIYGHMTKRLELEIIHMAFFSGIGKRGDIEKQPAHIRRAFHLGRKLRDL